LHTSSPLYRPGGRKVNEKWLTARGYDSACESVESKPGKLLRRLETERLAERTNLP
jgi:hypothetical protein